MQATYAHRSPPNRRRVLALLIGLLVVSGLAQPMARPAAAADAPWLAKPGSESSRIGQDTSVGSDLPAPNEPVAWLLRGERMHGATLVIRVTWGRWTHPDMPIVAHRLQLSRDGGPWTRTKVRSGTNQGAHYKIAFGSTYRFRLQAVDAAGDRSPWAVSSRTTRISRVDDRSASVVRVGAWHHRSDASAYRHTLTGSGQAGASLARTFTGYGVGVVVPATHQQRNVDVYIDGVYRTTLRLHAINPPRSRKVVYEARFSAGGTHTIELRVRAGRRPEFRFDAFVILR
ncbi:MAG: hypothetical protein E4H24_04925 [Thermomicrobiales bacterium]|nr:MAG: hypothetical protein E4H24_04925 [Thermomicrobiales bacterium]